MNSDPPLPAHLEDRPVDWWDQKEEKGCVVKSSHSNVKQAQARAYILLDFSPQATSFSSILPLTRFMTVILEIILIIYVRDLHCRPEFGLMSRSDLIILTQRAFKAQIWPRGLKKDLLVRKCHQKDKHPVSSVESQTCFELWDRVKANILSC